ncbi:histidine kinase [Cellulomonas soli]|uniref:sensor histidine kinase n=1 Tax=Cellulomonas soli TaxID=931535 RepID=UPI003F856C7F
MGQGATRSVGAPRAAAAVALVAWTLAVAAVVVRVAARVPFEGDLLFFVVDATAALVQGAVAAVVLARRAHPVGWLVAVMAVGCGASAVGGAWSAYRISHPLVPAAEPVAALYGWAWVPGTLALFLVVPWLVREGRLPPVARTGATAGGVLAAAMTAQQLLAPQRDNTGLLAAAVVLGLLTAAATAWRHRHGSLEERPGLGLLALGTALMAASFIPLLFLRTAPDLMMAVPLTHLACQVLFPVALLVTVLRNRLWGIDLAVSRASILALLTLGLVVVYAAVTLAVTALVGNDAVARAAAAVGVVLAVQPARTRLDRQVRRLVYGEAANPGHAALLVGAHLSAADDSDALLRTLAAGVGESLRLESVTLAPADGALAPVTWGRATSVPYERRLERGGRVVGTLTFTGRPGERLDSRSATAVDGLLPVVSAGMALTAGAHALARARDTATRARLAERQLIRRELHDGIGPWLTGLGLGLQAARNTLGRDPSATAVLLGELQAEVDQRVQDVRLLSRSLLPPVLDEHGLAAALEDLAQRTDHGFGVHLDIDDVRTYEESRQLDARVAAAAYAIVAESVVNAGRHSGADGCRVSVRIEAGPGVPPEAWLAVSCLDDGVGVPPDATTGVGTRSLRERAEELGGAVEIVPGPTGRGTLVRARVPLSPEPTV